MNPQCLKSASETPKDESHGSKQPNEKPRLQGKGHPSSLGYGPSRRKKPVASSPLRNCFFPEPGSIGETFVFSNSSTGLSSSSPDSPFFDFLAAAFGEEESEAKPEPVVKVESVVKPESKTKAKAGVLKSVTLNLQSIPEEKEEEAEAEVDEKKRLDEAAAARARTRDASRSNAMAKDPFASSHGGLRRKREASAFIQSKAFKHGDQPFKSTRAEPVLTTAGSVRPNFASLDQPITSNDHSNQPSRDKKHAIKDALVTFHASAHLVAQAHQALSVLQKVPARAGRNQFLQLTLSQEDRTGLFWKMEHCVKVVDGRLVLLEWALSQAYVHTKKEMVEYAIEAQSLYQARNVMIGTLAMLKRNEKAINHWQAQSNKKVQNTL